MRPPTIEYVRPTSVVEAIQTLSRADNAKALAGGHSLIPAMNIRLAQPDLLVDLGRLDELRGIHVTDMALRIGALSTHAEVATSLHVKKYFPALASAASMIGDPHVRNWGTIGGNLAHADPAADLPPPILAGNAVIQTQGVDGTRSIAVDDFFIDLFAVDLMPGELIVAVELPLIADRRSAYAKFHHPASHYALVGVCVVLDMKADRCQSARVAVGGSVPKATRSPGAEAVLLGAVIDNSTVDLAAEALLEDIADSVMGDLFAPADYRKTMTQVYFRRAVHAALS